MVLSNKDGWQECFNRTAWWHYQLNRSMQVIQVLFLLVFSILGTCRRRSLDFILYWDRVRHAAGLANPLVRSSTWSFPTIGVAEHSLFVRNRFTLELERPDEILSRWSWSTHMRHKTLAKQESLLLRSSSRRPLLLSLRLRVSLDTSSIDEAKDRFVSCICSWTSELIGRSTDSFAATAIPRKFLDERWTSKCLVWNLNVAESPHVHQFPVRSEPMRNRNRKSDHAVNDQLIPSYLKRWYKRVTVCMKLYRKVLQIDGGRDHHRSPSALFR